jgi:dCMP deaminase
MQNALLTAAQLGIALKGSNVYTTMRPCFGCAKEMLQAGVQAVYFKHEWNPPKKDDPVQTLEEQKEYEKLLLRFPNGVHRVDLDDPSELWAVATKRAEYVQKLQSGTKLQ